MLKVLGSTWPLLFGLMLLMLGNGMQGTLLGIRGAIENFSTTQMSVVMSCYFIGFLFGSRMAPEMIRRVGHVRVYAALGSLISSVMLLTVLGRRSQSASGLSWAMLMVFAMLGGGMLPLVAMPPWLQQLSTASPVSWALLAIEGALWRGYGLGDMAIPCGGLVAMGVLSFVWGAWRFSYD